MNKGITIKGKFLESYTHRLAKILDYLHSKKSIIDCAPVNVRERIGINAHFILFDWKLFEKYVKTYDGTVAILKAFQTYASRPAENQNITSIEFMWPENIYEKQVKVKVTAHLKGGEYKILTFKEVL